MNKTHTGATRIVIEGSIDLELEGDAIVVETKPQRVDVTHWKIIDVPQLTLSDMPLIHVYTKSYVKTGVVEAKDPSKLWRESTNVVYDEKSVLILYKLITSFKEKPQSTIYQMNGDYKIVVVK